FQAGELVKIAGVTKGRGFQGVVKRHGFGGGPATHGNTRHRKPGSISPGTDPSRVIKGKKMPGHMGAEQLTETGLVVVKVDAEKHLLFVRGAVPGPAEGTVVVRKQPGRGRYA
ncbi:MAG: 50S ribosomal protein L3, partial [Gemmatimonadetes bacterium]|nr:50S ribosomal protein L3 [Gemmatimonadota bacterium]